MTPVTTTPTTGTLTPTTITGLDMAGGITYGTIEHLKISLGSAADTFTIQNTHGAATSPFQESTIVNTGAGNDTVTINGVTDLLSVNGEAHADTINVNATGLGSVSTLNGDAGNDIFNIRGMVGTLTSMAAPTMTPINVGSDAPSRPSAPTIK